MVNHHFGVCGLEPFKNGLFMNRTHLKTGLVLYSDGYCIGRSSEPFDSSINRIVTVVLLQKSQLEERMMAASHTCCIRKKNSFVC